MCHAAKDIFHALFVQRFGGVNYGAAGDDLVVEHQRGLAFDFTDDIHGLADVVVVHPPLFNDGQRGAEALRDITGLLADADVDGHHYQVLNLFGGEIIAQEWQSRQLVHGDIEETLDLTRVQVDGQQAVGAGCG